MHNDLQGSFPTKIDLGRDVPDYDSPSPGSPAKKDPKRKMVKSYPTLYISDVSDLPMLPKEGYALIYFRRKGMNLRDDKEHGEVAGADLEIQELCLPEEAPDAGEKDLESAFAAFAGKKGVDTEDAPADEDDADTDETDDGDDEEAE